MGRDDLLPKTIGPGVVIAEAEAAAPRVWVVAAIPTAARLVPKKFAGQPWAHPALWSTMSLVDHELCWTHGGAGCSIQQDSHLCSVCY